MQQNLERGAMQESYPGAIESHLQEILHEPQNQTSELRDLTAELAGVQQELSLVAMSIDALQN
jgi:hypothetical protein